MKYCYILMSFLVLGLVCSGPICAQESDLIKQSVIPATDEHGAIRFGVMVPPSYENNSRSYPVIYYMHGMNRYYLSPRAQWIASFFNKQFKEGQLPEFIMVFIDGGEGFWCDHTDGNPMLETEIVNYLIPEMDKNYRTNPSKRLTMGWSAGGVGAVTFYTKHPELVAAAISLDGALMTWEEFVYFQGEKPEIFGNAEYYYEYGAPHNWVDRNRESLIDKPDTSIFISAAYLKESNLNFLSILEAEGIPAKYMEVNCDHEFGCVFSESQKELLLFIAKSLNQVQ